MSAPLAALDGIDPWPCHRKPRKEWCDRSGKGDFMGHTCVPPKAPEAVRDMSASLAALDDLQRYRVEGDLRDWKTGEVVVGVRASEFTGPLVRLDHVTALLLKSPTPVSSNQCVHEFLPIDSSRQLACVHCNAKYRQELVASLPSDIRAVCTAYESGFGDGRDGREKANPYMRGSNEWYAFEHGRLQGAARRSQSETKPPHWSTTIGLQEPCPCGAEKGALEHVAGCARRGAVKTSGEQPHA